MTNKLLELLGLGKTDLVKRVSANREFAKTYHNVLPTSILTSQIKELQRKRGVGSGQALGANIAQPTVTPTPTNTPTMTPTPTGIPTPLPTPSLIPTAGEFGMGEEQANIEPALYAALLALEASEEERRNIAELSGQESSYGYADPHITEKEESYGPFHINLMAGRIDPKTGEKFTREGAEDIENVVKYALSEYRRTGGLGAWNPGAYDFYQKDLPKRAKTKKYKKGK